MRIAFILLLALSSGAGAAPQLDKIKLPPGFHISIYAEGMERTRSLAMGERGTLFVGSTGSNVYAVPAGGGKPVVIARGLDAPHGVAVRDGALYVAEVGRIQRYDRIEDQLGAPPKPVVVSELPRERHHGAKTIRFGPDGLLYVNIGSPCNVCARKGEFSTISRLDVSRPGAQREVYANGVRNSVGFDWDPRTRELWFTDNGRDLMGNDVPPDELNHAPRAGMDFGFPYCHGGDIADPEFGRQRACRDFTPPAQKLGPHVASLGMRFYTGTKFPAEYRDAIFIAEHGSWNRENKIGYRVTVVKLKDGRASSYETFAQGWLQGEEAWGRPVDVIVAPDGALLVSDDRNGVVYRIDYTGK